MQIRSSQQPRCQLLTPSISKGIAVGYQDSASLADGTFDRSRATYADPANVLCPNGSGAEGLCPASLATSNADSWALTAAGISFTTLCGRQIPLV
jgi:hypothetical protein